MKINFEYIIKKKVRCEWFSFLFGTLYIYDELVTVTGDSETEIDVKARLFAKKVKQKYDFDEKTMKFELIKRRAGRVI